MNNLRLLSNLSSQENDIIDKKSSKHQRHQKYHLICHKLYDLIVISINMLKFKIIYI